MKRKFLSVTVLWILVFSVVGWIDSAVTSDEKQAPTSAGITMTLEWSKEVNCDEYGLARSTPVITEKNGEILIITASDRSIVCYDSSGNIQWCTDLSEGYECTYPDWYGFTPVAADLDNDGIDEIVISTTILYSDKGCNPCTDPGCLGTRKPVIFCVDLEGNILWKKCGYGAMYSIPAIFDIDEDNELEIIYGVGFYVEGGSQNNGVVCLGSDGTEKWFFDSPGNSVESSPAISDIDNDGSVEIIFGSEDMYLWVINNNGELIWHRFLSGGSCSGSVTPSPLVADINSDGYKEIVIGNDCGDLFAYSHDGQRLWVLLKDEYVDIEEKWPSIKSSATAADIDNDGDLEILLGQAYGFDGGTNGYLLAVDDQGNIVWKAQTSPSWCSPALCDVTGDGNKEIFFTDLGGNFYIFSSNGEQLAKKHFDDTGIMASPIVGDIDQDQNIEVIIKTGIDGTTPNWGIYCYEISEITNRGSILWGRYLKDNTNRGAAAPYSPENLQVNRIVEESGQIVFDLSWQDGSEDEEVFYVYRNGELIHTLNTNTLSYRDNDPSISVGEIYQYYITAYNIAGESIPSNKVNIAAQHFPDVPPEYWGFPYIEYMYTNDIISGYLDGTFKPNNNVTRAQFCKMIVNTLGIEQYFPATPTFSDVAPDYWGYGYIEAAHKEGIINGYVDGTFRPNNEVSRQHVAAMIARAVGLTYSGTEVVFSDVPVDHPYYEEIMACYDAGIISGYLDGTFRPNNIATRAHASKFLCGMIGIVF